MATIQETRREKLSAMLQAEGIDQAIIFDPANVFLKWTLCQGHFEKNH